MSLNPSEISELIRERIREFHPAAEVRTEGRIVALSDGIVRLHGLNDVMQGEMIEFPEQVFGVALNLEKDSVGAVILGDYKNLAEGMTAKCTNRILEVPVGEGLLGRVVDALGRPIDGKGPMTSQGTSPIEKVAPGVIYRQSVTQPLQTGIKSIDTMVPIGRGQRELIIGDRQTGKTAVAIDTIINQKNTGVICIYVAIGQKASSIAAVVRKLEEHDAMAHTIVVAASAADSAALQFIAPYAGCAMGEYFRDKGEDALIIYDDLTKQAWAYRQISLLLRRPPGREAYPGDVFYLHSRLLERAARVNEIYVEKATSGKVKGKTGSLTALPIIETQAGDVSAFIPTNVISITDGQIFLETDLFNAGIRPAINTGLSVSRVGGAAQTKIMKKLGGGVRLSLAQYRELAAFAQFASDLDEVTRKQLNKGQRFTEIMKQGQYCPLTIAEMAVSLFAVEQGFLDDVDLKKIVPFERELHAYFQTNYSELFHALNEKPEYNDEVALKLRDVLTSLNKLKPGDRKTMAFAKEIRSKILSIKNTQKITRAMEMVAASKMRKAQERMFHARPYAMKIRTVISHLARSNPEYKHPFLKERPVRRTGLIIISSDRGLCGGLNMNVLRTSTQTLKEWQEKGAEVGLCLIGSKAENFFRRTGGNIMAHASHLGDAPGVAQLVGTIKVMLDAYIEERIDALFLIHNQFVNSMTQKPIVLPLLPIEASQDEKIASRWDYIYEPDAKELLDLLLRRYIESQIYRGVIENIACEQAARMVAMKNASDNANDFINTLQLAYNKARQASITRELAEIVAGASAVEGG